MRLTRLTRTMEKALVSAAVGFAVAILMAVGSVELIAIDPALASTLMGAAMVIAAGVAGVLIVALGLERRERSRFRRARVAAAAGEAGADAATQPQRHLPMQTVAWPARPDEVVIDAPAATESDSSDIDLPCVPAKGRRRIRSTDRPLLVRLVRHGEWSIPTEWVDAVVQADFDAIFLDPRAHDEAEPDEPVADLIGRAADPRAVNPAA